ncbi:MAG: YciI family protein [Lachnospiraceae bacterium]|nr:YciI family protein [Lachnospiraceae bacterium]
MQYIVRAYDGENMLEKRMEVRPRHLDNMSKINGKVLFAGGLLDDAGKMKGSVLILDFDDPALIDDYLASEPYIQEKVWEKVEVEHINAVLVNGEKVGK